MATAKERAEALARLLDALPDGVFVGILTPGSTQSSRTLVANPAVRTEPVATIMQKAFPYVDIETPLALLAPMITQENPAVLVRDFPANKPYVLTGYDVLQAM